MTPSLRRHLHVNLFAQNGNDLFALIILGLLTTSTFLALALVYFPIRRRQLGGAYAAMSTAALAVMTLDLALVIGWVIVTNHSAAMIGWHTAAILGLIILWVMIDFGRHRATRPISEDVVVEFGSGMPGTLRMSGLKNIGWMTTVFMFSIFPRVMRLLQKGRAEVLLPLGALVLYGLIRAVLDNHTKWTCTDYGISVWGRPPMGWSEIRDYRWANSFSETSRTLVLNTEFGDEILCPVAGPHIKPLQDVLRKHLGEPTSSDLPTANDTTAQPATGDEPTTIPAWAQDGRTTFLRYEVSRESLARSHGMGSSQRGCRSVLVWLLLLFGIASIAGALFVLKTHPLVILAVALFLLLVGFLLLFVVWPVVIGGWSKSLSDTFMTSMPHADRPEQVVLVTSEGLVFPAGARKNPPVRWENIDRAVLIDEYLILSARIAGIGASVGLMAVSPREVIEGDFDRFVMEVDSRTPVERA